MEIERRGRVVGILPNELAVPLVRTVLADTHDEWQVYERQYSPKGSMAKLYSTSDTETFALEENDR